MSSPPSLPASPPHKRLKTQAEPELPLEVGVEIHSQTSAEPFVQTALEEAPVKALFVPTGATSVAGPAGPSNSNSNANVNSKQKARKRKQKRPVPEVYSPADVLFHDIKDFLGKEYVEDILAQGDPAWEAPEDLHTQSVVELRVGAFTVSGMFRLLSPTQTTPKELLYQVLSDFLKSKEENAVADAATQANPSPPGHRTVLPNGPSLPPLPILATSSGPRYIDTIDFTR
jgi:tRNA (uracil-5-)-methyltransferase